MKHILTLLLLLPLLAQAQNEGPGCTPELKFYYDAAGNRIQRKEICDTQGTSTARLETQEISLLVTPNPSEGRFVIRLSEPIDDVEFSILDAHGRMIRSSALPGDGIKIDLSDQPDGVYFLRVIGPGMAWSESLVKR